MTNVGNYNPSDVIVRIGTRVIKGFADGTFVEVARNNPAELTPVPGAKGEYTFVENNDKTGTVTITLQADAESNIYMNSLSGSKAIVPIFISRKGKNVQELVTATEAVVQEKPQKSYDAENPARAWVIGAGNLIQSDTGVL